MTSVNKYSKTVIYKLMCKDLLVLPVYIGHTIKFVERIRVHKTHIKTYKSKMYEFIRNTGGWDNWCVVVLETVCCVDRQEAINLEQKYMSEHDHILNNNKAILCR